MDQDTKKEASSTKSERQKMVDGEPFAYWDKELDDMFYNAKVITREFNIIPEENIEKRFHLLKKLFGSTGETIYIEPPFRCDYGVNIHVGENFYANYDCIFSDSSYIRIGKNCMIGPGTHIYTVNHSLDPEERQRQKYGLAKPVKIGDDCWIGGKVIILPGVTIGNNVVVGAGSVVTKDVPDNIVVAGNPAKKIKDITIKK